MKQNRIRALCFIVIIVLAGAGAFHIYKKLEKVQPENPLLTQNSNYSQMPPQGIQEQTIELFNLINTELKDNQNPTQEQTQKQTEESKPEESASQSTQDDSVSNRLEHSNRDSTEKTQQGRTQTDSGGKLGDDGKKPEKVTQNPKESTKESKETTIEKETTSEAATPEETTPEETTPEETTPEEITPEGTTPEGTTPEETTPEETTPEETTPEETTPEETVAPENRIPKISTNIVDRVTVYEPEYSFRVVAKDYKGNPLVKEAQTVTRNGSLVSYASSSSSANQYQLELEDGTNKIEIVVQDEEGNQNSKSYTIYYEESKVIGSVKFSIQASTVGLGYLVDPITVDINSGDNGAMLLTRVLSDYGYTYNNTGTLKSGFYLKGIEKKNLVQSPSIPEELHQLLLKKGANYHPDKYEKDSLSEFDFSSGSGWMYSVNGDYIGDGFSEYIPKDRDIIKVRYTLWYGNDIGDDQNGDGKVWGDW